MISKISKLKNAKNERNVLGAKLLFKKQSKVCIQAVKNIPNAHGCKMYSANLSYDVDMRELAQATTLQKRSLLFSTAQR